MTDEIWFRFVVALGIGLLVGADRERSKGSGPTRREAGIRTFALAAMLGAISMHLGGPTLLAAATAAAGALVAVAYFRRRGDDPGLTTEISFLVTVLLGGMAVRDSLLAAGLGVALAIILAAKGPVHAFVRETLTQAELRDAFILAFATVIVWPALPDQAMGPYGAINPYKLWALVILVMVIGGAGHIATRAIGAAYGLALSGFASGFVSSAATVGAMAQRSQADPSQTSGAVAGASLSTVATFIQMAILLAIVSPPTAFALAPALVAGALAASAYGLWFTWRAVDVGQTDQSPQGGAFSIKTALLLAATLALMLIAAAFARESLGQAGVIVGAALAGFADTHAAAISVASLTAADRLTPAEAVIPILAAMTCNAITKGALAVSAGSRQFSGRIVPGLILSIAAAWAGAWASRWAVHWAMG